MRSIYSIIRILWNYDDPMTSVKAQRRSTPQPTWGDRCGTGHWLIILRPMNSIAPAPPNPSSELLRVYYDGGCPICRAEISAYQRAPGGESICWTDVTRSTPDALGTDLDPKLALARFHVRKPDGTLLSGAAAFVEVWGHLRNWRWLSAVGRLPGVLLLMEFGYRMFLKLRPLWRKA